MMKKYIQIILVMLMAIGQSCTKNFDKINSNPSQFYSPEPEPVFTGVVKATADRMAQANDGFLWTQSNLMVSGGANYQTGDDATWTTYYTNILGNLTQLKNTYKDNPAYANRMFIEDIWECYIYATLVGTYGPIPYSKAMQGQFGAVAYDDENAIYASLLERLKKDANGITLTGDKLVQDIVFNADLANSLLHWKKFANSLRLRLALRCQRNQPTLAAAAITELMANEGQLLSANTDNVTMPYGVGEGNEARYYINYIKNNLTNANQGTANVPRLSDELYLYFRSYNDPRMKAYFDPINILATTSTSSGFNVAPFITLDTLSRAANDSLTIVNYKIPYYGMARQQKLLPTWTVFANVYPGGGNNTNANVPKPNLFAQNYAFVFMNYAEVCFLKAEAAQLGYTGTKSAEQYYYDGINANCAVWGITGAEATAYLAQNGIKWNTIGKGYNHPTGLVNANIPDNLTRIWVQEWINFYLDGGFDAWCLQRRSNAINLWPNTSPNTVYFTTYADMPDRWQYPNVEIINNGAGYAEGKGKLSGTDRPDTRLNFAASPPRVNWANARVFVDKSIYQKWYGTTMESLIASGVPYTIVGKIKRP
jgi:hypothetical protein